MSTNRILLALLLLLGIIQVTGAVKCFVCEYQHLGSEKTGDEECNDSFGGNTKFEEECSGSNEFCYKLVASGEYLGQKLHTYVDRDCGRYYNCQKEGVQEVDSEYGKASLHCCKGDLCNSATTALPGLTVLLASSLFWLL